jgi:hypothetical protein
MIIYAIIVFKSVIYGWKFLFVESTKGEFIIGISARVLTLFENKNLYELIRLKFKTKKLDPLCHIRYGPQ